MSLAEMMRENERLLILRILKEANGYTANESIIDRAMTMWGHSVSRDTVKNHLTWLGEQQVIKCEQMGGYIVATLCQRGLDVIEGTSRVPGIAKPGPKA